jgi:hypothetical protein
MDMVGDFAGKHDLTINPLVAVMGVLILFWGTIALLLWRFF